MLAGLVVIPACVMAQTLPTMPSGGPDNGTFDKEGRYPAGTVSAVTYYSPSIGSNNTMWVYTPPGYATSKKYGVVYGYPGIGAGADTIFYKWGALANIVADNLIGEGKIQPLIIVGVDDNKGDVQADTLNVVIPYIDSHYSTYADADHRGLYGYSYGGGYAFNIGCSHLDTFHHLSPSSAAPNKAGDTTLFPNGGAQAKQKLKTLLISCGDADYEGLYPASLNCHNYCVSNGIPNYWWSVAGGNHNAGVWRPAMWNFLQLAERGGISSVTYKRLQNRATGLCVDGMGRTANGSACSQYSSSGSNNQYWNLLSNGQIQNKGTGLMLDSLGRTGNGSVCGQWGNGSSNNQRWTQETTGGYAKFKNKANGLYLDGMGSTGNGASLCMWSGSSSSNQQFSIQ
jgi:enterochelin esterase-like enzyme